MKSTYCVTVLVTLVLSLLPGVIEAQQTSSVAQPAETKVLVRPAEAPLLLPIVIEPYQTSQPPASTQQPQVKPTQPAQPVQPAPTAPQASPENVPQQNAASFARANEAVASAPRSLTPGVFGDIFGGNCLKIFTFGQDPGNRILDGVCATPPSALVGRFKVAENNSPMPRDRAFFNYNFFSGTILGVNVNRFTAGVEKTLFDGSASVEVRLPFASTLSDQQLGDSGATSISNGTTTILGDLQIVTKFLIAENDSWAFSTGIGIAVPTAPDLYVNNNRGNTILKIDNQAVHLQPYLAYIYTPDDRFYLQGFSAIDIDLNGDPAEFSAFPNFGSPLNPIGRLRDRTFWTTDLAVGYWVYRNDCASWVTGLAPQLEVHWNQALDKFNTISDQFGGIAGESSIYSNVNLGTILNVEIRNSSRLALGAVFPVTNNRDFSIEFAVLFNYQF